MMHAPGEEWIDPRTGHRFRTGVTCWPIYLGTVPAGIRNVVLFMCGRA